MANIFSDENKVKGNWWKQETIGDKIQGTYIGRRQVVNQLSGKEQWIYEIKDENGEYWNIGGKPIIDVQMRHVKPGQVVGFEYTEERANKKPGLNPTKVVQVYANAKVIDPTFVEEEEEARRAELQGEKTENAAEAQEAMAKDAQTTDAKIAQIMKIAEAKWGLTDPAQVKQKVMEETELAFIESNLDKIVIAIK